VRLTTGDEFHKIVGSLEVGWQSDEVKLEKAIGVLGYFQAVKGDSYDSPTGYSGRVSVPDQQFRELLRAAHEGRLPKAITLYMEGEGIKIGWEPDGSGVDWDNKKEPYLPIKEISFSVPLVAPPDEKDDDSQEEQPSTSLPPSKAQLDQIASKLDQLNTVLSGLPKLLIGLIFGLAIVIIVTR